MKKTALMLLMPLVVAVGCSNEEEITLSAEPMIISAAIDNEEAARTTLSSDAKSVFWEKNDSLSVFLGGNIMNCAVVYGEPDGSDALFIVDGSFIIGGTVDKEGDFYTNLALYPYYASAVLVASDTVKTYFPATQKAVLQSIPDGSPMVAAVGNVSTTTFTFKNVCSFIRFNISTTGALAVSRIVLTAEDKPLAGDILINIEEGGLPSSQVLEDNSVNTITLECDRMPIGPTPTAVFMAVIPGEFENEKWNVEIFEENGGSVKYLLPEFTLERRNYYTLNIDYTLD